MEIIKVLHWILFGTLVKASLEIGIVYRKICICLLHKMANQETSWCQTKNISLRLQQQTLALGELQRGTGPLDFITSKTCGFMITQMHIFSVTSIICVPHWCVPHWFYRQWLTPICKLLHHTHRTRLCHCRNAVLRVIQNVFCIICDDNEQNV